MNLPMQAAASVGPIAPMAPLWYASVRLAARSERYVRRANEVHEPWPPLPGMECFAPSVLEPPSAAKPKTPSASSSVIEAPKGMRLMRSGASEERMAETFARPRTRVFLSCGLSTFHCDFRCSGYFLVLSF